MGIGINTQNMLIYSYGYPIPFRKNASHANLSIFFCKDVVLRNIGMLGEVQILACVFRLALCESEGERQRGRISPNPIGLHNIIYSD